VKSFWDGFEKRAALKKDVELQEHQKRVLDKLKNTNSLLLYHGLGSGKTLSSIAGTEGMKTDVVVPASLRTNYEKELNKFTNKTSPRNVMSYEKATRGPLEGGQALVLDEVQRLNNPAAKRSQELLRAAPKYQRRILLSGTPIRNNPSELSPILRVLNPEDKRVPLDSSEFYHRFIKSKAVSPGVVGRLRGIKPGIVESPKNLHVLRDVLKGHVDYYEPSKEGYPSASRGIVEVPMSDEQADIYEYVTNNANPIIARKVRMNLPLSRQESKQLNAFMTATRIVSNTAKPYGGKGESPKMVRAAQDLVEANKEDKNFKALVYSNYLDGGVKEYSRHLEQAGIPHMIFSGELNDKKRREAVNAFNSGKIRALLITGAGSEGLDLKGTKMVQILEPHWNKARIDQAVGRSIRYKSHEHLPEEERHVKVLHYHSVHPDKWYNRMLPIKRSTAADTYLYGLSERKDALNQQFLDVLKEVGRG
jgi:SNF2 family DNA or RNA helicase